MKRLGALLLVLCLMVGAAASAESAFVPIPREAEVSPYVPSKACYLPDRAGYHDASIDIRVETFRRDDTTVMAAHITLSDASQLRTATASKTYPSKKLVYVSAMAKREHAVLAINGDYFAYHNQGIVVRNGRVLRSRPNPGRDTLIIDENGDFTILSPTSREAFEAFPREVVQAFCFGPGLVVDGEALTETDHLTIDNGKNRKTQRIAIGQTGPLQYVVVTCEGPENKGSVGMDLVQFAAVCKELGCLNAYNLDGGSSCTIALDGKKINALSSGKIRAVSDAICFDTLVP